jgi:hypothetical protein
MTRSQTLALVLSASAVVGLNAFYAFSADEPAEDPAVARARREVKMLDDLYKTAVVLVTDAYVDDEGDLGAGSAFRALFDAMREKEWHDARLVDATGQPYEPTNAPREGFETEAIEQLLAGEMFVERVIEEDGQRYYLAATAIPVVMDKCIMCHAHYADVPAGQAIGAISYRVPIQE